MGLDCTAFVGVARLRCHWLFHQLVGDFTAEMLRDYEIARGSHATDKLVQELVVLFLGNVGNSLQSLLIMFKRSHFCSLGSRIFFVPEQLLSSEDVDVGIVFELRLV